MQPSDGLWSGAGEAVAASPGWMVVGALLVLGVLIIVARYIVPSRERIKMRELDIRQREADIASERVEANRALAEQTRGMRASVDALATQQAEQTAQLTEARSRSHEMGGEVRHIRSTTDHTAEQVDELHRAIVRKVRKEHE